jgi:hypothetical protein
MFRSLPSLTYNFASPNQAAVHLLNANVSLSAPPIPVSAPSSSVPGYHIPNFQAVLLLWVVSQRQKYTGDHSPLTTSTTSEDFLKVDQGVDSCNSLNNGLRRGGRLVGVALIDGCFERSVLHM